MKIKNLVDNTTSFLFKRLAEATGLALLVLSVLLLISFAQTASYTLAPIVYAHYESGGKKWDPQNKSISVVGWGVALRAEIDRLNIELDAYNNRFIGISQKPNYFNRSSSKYQWWSDSRF